MSEDTLERRFHKAARRWRDGVAFHSFYHCMVKHEAYAELKAMGKDIIPFLLNKLKRDKWIAWSFLLAEITGEKPNYKPEPVGKGWVEPGAGGFVAFDVTALAKAWLQWGVEKGYIQGATDGHASGDQGGGGSTSNAAGEQKPLGE